MQISIMPYKTQNQINFKNTELNKRAAQELETVVKPFLEQYKRPQDKGLLEEIGKKLQKLKILNIRPEYQPKEFEEVKRLHLAELDSNLDEFEYLAEKSEKWFAGDEARKMAETLRKSELFRVPSFLAAPLHFYKQLKADINNGLANMTFDKLAPVQYKKEQELSLASSGLRLNSLWYNHVGILGERIQQSLENDSLTLYSFTDRMGKIQDNIVKHKKELPLFEETAKKAEDINKRISVTAEDEDIINNIHKPAQRVISRNVTKFNKRVQSTNLSDEQQNFLIELLNKQKAAIENLWHTIEKSKKSAFVYKNEASHADPHIDNIYSVEDIPF